MLESQISQAKLAKLLGVVEGTIQNYEHGHTEPNITRLYDAKRLRTLDDAFVLGLGSRTRRRFRGRCLLSVPEPLARWREPPPARLSSVAQNSDCSDSRESRSSQRWAAARAITRAPSPREHPRTCESPSRCLTVD